MRLWPWNSLINTHLTKASNHLSQGNVQNTDHVFPKRQSPQGGTFGIDPIPSLLLKSVSTWQSSPTLQVAWIKTKRTAVCYSPGPEFSAPTFQSSYKDSSIEPLSNRRFNSTWGQHVQFLLASLSHTSVTLATGFYQNTSAVIGNELLCITESVQSHYNGSHLHNN